MLSGESIRGTPLLTLSAWRLTASPIELGRSIRCRAAPDRGDGTFAVLGRPTSSRTLRGKTPNQRARGDPATFVSCHQTTRDFMGIRTRGRPGTPHAVPGRPSERVQSKARARRVG